MERVRPMPEGQSLISVSYILSEILTHTQRRCIHHDEDKESPETRMPSTTQPLEIGNTSKVDKKPAPFDYTLNTLFSDVDLEATPFDDPVSQAVSALSLGAPSVPRGLQDSAQGSTISEFADPLSIHKAQSSNPSYLYSFRDIEGAGLQDPTQQYSYTDPITGAVQSLGSGQTFHTDRHTSTYSQSPSIQQSSYSQVAIPQYESKARAGGTAKAKEKSSESSSSPSGGSDQPRPKRRLEDKEGGGSHRYAETGHEKSKKVHKDTSGSKDKEKKDERADKDKNKNKKRPRTTK